MSITPRTLRPIIPFRKEEPANPFTLFRERIASRCEEHARLFPRAVDLEARLTAGVHGTLHGVASLLRGIHSVRRWLEVLQGHKHLRVSDLCRLATDPSREAKAAARVALTVLAEACGYRLEPLPTNAPELHEAMAEQVNAEARLQSELLRGLADGALSPAESLGLDDEMAARDAAAAKVRAAIVKAREARA